MKYKKARTIALIVAGVFLVLVGVPEIKKQYTYHLLNENHVKIDSWSGGLNSFLERPNSSWFASPVVAVIVDTSGNEAAISMCFKRLPTIENVSYMCSGKKIESSNLAPLLDLPNLNGLDIYECQLDTEAWSLIGRLPGLKWIKTESSGITDKQLKNIQTSNSLSALYFQSEDITLDGIKSLVPLKLKKLDVSYMRNLKKQHLVEIKKLLPDAEVTIED